MTIRITIRLVFLTLLLALSSCVSRKNLTYLQYSAGSAGYDIPSVQQGSVTPDAYKVMPYDVLYVRVITPDPQWSSLFNADIGTTGITQESAALSGYTVDANGIIEIPFVKSVQVGGKTISEIKVQLDSIFKNYVTDAAIVVKLVNNYVSVIGEVRLPGRYLLTKDRITVFEALAMAGDMSEHSNRQKVQLIRPSPYGPIVKDFTLSDRSILSSEYYYIMPNDIIYAVPRQSKAFQVNSSVWTIFLTTITSALGMIAFFRTL